MCEMYMSTKHFSKFQYPHHRVISRMTGDIRTRQMAKDEKMAIIIAIVVIIIITVTATVTAILLLFDIERQARWGLEMGDPIGGGT